MAKKSGAYAEVAATGPGVNADRRVHREEKTKSRRRGLRFWKVRAHPSRLKVNPQDHLLGDVSRKTQEHSPFEAPFEARGKQGKQE